MNKKVLSFIITLSLTVTISGNAFAAPVTKSSTALEQTVDKKKELQSKVEQLDKEVDEVLNKVDENKNAMNKIGEDIKETESKLKTVESNVKTQEDLLRKRARAIYVNGGGSYLEVILSSQSLSDFMSRIDRISTIMEYDKKIVTKLNEEKESIVKHKDSLNEENNKLRALKEKNEIVLSKLNKDIREQKSILSQINEKEKALIEEQKKKEVAMAETSNSSNNSTSSQDRSLSRGESTSSSYSKVMYMEATAYAGDGYTASGSATKRNASGYSTIAVDPRVIPMGSRVYVEGYGYAVAEDTGGAIQGNRIDVFVNSEAEARSWGRRSVKVYIIGN